MKLLIPDIRRAWRYITIQIAAFAVVWGSLPVDMQTSILALVGVGPERIPAILGLLIIIGRLIKQKE